MELSTGDIWGNIFAIVVLCILAGAVGYSSGFRDGHSEGYVRGRAIASAMRERLGNR